MAEDDEPFGKTGEILRSWFRTFMMVLRRRRALLLSSGPEDKKPMPPLAFMLGGTAAAYGAINLASPKAPPLELPDSISLVEQLLSMLGNVNSVLSTALTMLSAGIVWIFFRAFCLRLPWKAAIRQMAYCGGALAPASILLATTPLTALGKLGPAGVYLAAAGWLIYLLSFLALQLWLLLQYAAESGVRVRRTLLPFSIASIVGLALFLWMSDAQPDEWILGPVGSMMAPAVLQGDDLHVDLWSIYGHTFKPGDVVTILSSRYPRRWFPFGGALQTAMFPVAARVLAVPGDHVAARGSDLVVNGQILSREPASRPFGLPDAAIAFKQHLGERDVLLAYGVNQHPVQCLSEEERVLMPDTYLLAFDTRLDALRYCGIFQRARITGLIDWNNRTKRTP